MRGLILALVLLFPHSLLAQGTLKDAAEGWIALFDGESNFGWKVDGTATIKDGLLVVGDPEKDTTISTTSAFGACEIRFIFANYAESIWTFAGREFYDPLREIGFKNPIAPLTNGPRGVFITSLNDAGNYGHKWEGHTVEGKAVVFTSKPGKKSKPTPLTIQVPKGKSLTIKQLHLRPTGSKSIFNGKDLSGWKTHNDKKASKFTVTSEGWLNVKDGPGDLQTEEKWADFILQFDCISNGKNLNSGIFFRCLPNLYQQGYEAQIRNQWEGDDRTKPVDFGTGAIYRRKPTRKVVSTDGEWFTMTVLAQGNHIATWVNGYPTVDWLDDRKVAENARNGLKTDAGALSIQGHDPTTDLSFRNFRITDLSK